MPLLPASLIEPLWVEFAALIGTEQRPEFAPAHPWGCHRRRIPDRVVFDHVIAALVHGSGTPAKLLADQLFISEHTLRNHLTSIYRKLGVYNRLELYAYATKHQLGELPPAS